MKSFVQVARFGTTVSEQRPKLKLHDQRGVPNTPHTRTREWHSHTAAPFWCRIHEHWSDLNSFQFSAAFSCECMNHDFTNITAKLFLPDIYLSAVVFYATLFWPCDLWYDKDKKIWFCCLAVYWLFSSHHHYVMTNSLQNSHRCLIYKLCVCVCVCVDVRVTPQSSCLKWQTHLGGVKVVGGEDHGKLAPWPWYRRWL